MNNEINSKLGQKERNSDYDKDRINQQAIYQNNQYNFQNQIIKKINEFYQSLVNNIKKEEQLEKIEELIFIFSSSRLNESSFIQCTYYTGEIIDNIEYLRKTVSNYYIDEIFNIFNKIAQGEGGEKECGALSNFLIEVYHSVQKLISDIQLQTDNKIEFTLSQFIDIENIITKVILLTEIDKLVSYYKNIILSNNIIASDQRIYNPNPLINLVAVEENYKNKAVSTLLTLDYIVEINKDLQQEQPSCKLSDIKVPTSIEESFHIL